MKLFATRVWGYDPNTWPVVTFGTEGNRSNLIRQSSAEDIVMFVGTFTDPTIERNKGRLLGLAQFGRVEVNTLDIVSSEATKAEDYDESGKFRWPKALIMTRAWRFTDDPLPLLTDILAQQLPRHATSQAVKLDERDKEAVFSLPALEVELPDTDSLRELRRLNTALTGNAPTTGVIPAAWESKVSRKLGNKSVTYALQFGTENCWKVGHTTDLDQRLREINRHIPSEVLGVQWKLEIKQDWPNETFAYDMEQRVLEHLSRFRTTGERVGCKQSELISAWGNALKKWD